MGRQIARLYIRGSLFNKTIKGLTKEQKETVDKLLANVWHDPEIQNSKHAFCMALRDTIGFEYQDKQCAMQEAMISLWKAAALALYHKPNEDTVNEPIIRRKFFKTIMMNYMKQIILENKIPAKKHKIVLGGPPAYVAKEVMISKLSRAKHDYTVLDKTGEVATLSLDDEYIITTDTDGFDEKTIINNLKLIQDLGKIGAVVSISRNRITITATTSDQTEFTIDDVKYLKLKSLDTYSKNESSDGKVNYHIEYEFGLYVNDNFVYGVEQSDFLGFVVSNVSDKAKQLMQILIDPPEDYTGRFKTKRICKSHLAKYLEISTKTLEDLYQDIEVQCIAGGAKRG